MKHDFTAADSWDSLAAFDLGNMLVGDSKHYDDCKQMFDELIEALEWLTTYFSSIEINDDESHTNFEGCKLLLARAKGGG